MCTLSIHCLVALVMGRCDNNDITDSMLSNLIDKHPERLLRSKHLIQLLQVGLAKGLLPVSNPPGSFKGLNEKLKPHGVPKRAWLRGAQSNSLSRHMQHMFMYEVVDSHGPRLRAQAQQEQRPVRCLDWDGWYGGSIFGDVCGEVDVIEYATPFGRQEPKRLHWTAGKVTTAKRWYHADAHTMADYLDNNAYDLVIANSVFEHLHRPFQAMLQVYKVLRPGGYLFWHTPFEFEEHGVPFDFFRYTVKSAQRLAQESGLTVEFAKPDGGYAAVLSNTLGLGAKFWPYSVLNETSSGSKPKHYLSTRMLAFKPRL